MKNTIKSLVLAVFCTSLAILANSAKAATPILSATYQGSNVVVSVSNANSFSAINLYTRQSSTLWTVVNNIGQTDGNGYFNQSISITNDGSASPLQMYVIVGGLQSPTVSVYQNGGGYYGSGCGYTGCNYGGYYGNNTLTLSQTNLNLTVGQTANVTSVTNYYGSLYVSSNSNSSVATAVTSGSGVSIYGQSAGSSSLVICSNGNAACATVYVVVTGTCYSGYCGSGIFSLSPTTLSLTSPQTASVSIVGGNYGSGYGYYVSSNSNSSVASASVSGSTLYVSSLVGGTDTITVCQSGNSSQCASVYVTVNGGTGCSTYGCGGGSLSLSQTSMTLTSGQSSIISAYNVPSLYVSSNSNPSVVTVTVNVNQATFYAQGSVSGSSTVVLCGINSSQCASVFVTVTGYGSGGNGSVTFSPSSVNINLGQSSTVNIYNSYSSGAFYISSNSNQSIVSASISGNSLYLLSAGIGNSTITVCQTGNSSCGILYVTVVGVSSGSFSLSQTSLNLSIGQNVSVTAYGGTGIYVSSSSNSAVAGYTISGNQINITGSAIGTTTLNICSTGGYGCTTLYVNVTGSSCGYYGCNGSGTISLSQSTLSLSLGQSGAVTVYGNGSYYVSSNSNSAVANALLSGNTLNVSGTQSGVSNIYICQNSGTSNCVTLYVTVSGLNGYNGTTNVVLSQSSLTLAVGQSITVNASGNGGYGFYLSANSNPGAVSATFNGSVLTVYGIANGASALQICQNGATACASLYVTVGVGGSNVLGASTYANGQLIAEGQSVYIVYKNTKTAFSSAYAFNGLGFSFNNVIQVGNSGLVNSGYIVTTPFASHPWGSWIQNGSTIYFVQEKGLIPVPDWNTFLNNGGSANLIVQANAYDMRLPVLYNMTYGDIRLR